MKKSILVLAMGLFLQGCLPAVFVAGAAAGGAVIYDNRSTKAMVTDRDITFQAQSKLDNDYQLHNQAHLSVATFNRIALLVGQAPTAEMRARAEKIVKSNTTLKMLYNEVTVEKPISEGARANDVWLTTKVKTVLIAEPGLKSTQLKIVSENGVVYLMGLTTRSQAELATEKTRDVAGVRKVVRLFEYLN